MIHLPAFRTGAAISVLAACVVSGAALTTATPAAARVDISIGINAGGISFGYFHQNLGHRGHWIRHPRWGDVWQPPNARHYRPYFNGYFEYTDYGLLWVGNDPWSNVTDHYGRWVYDPRYGALWIPGYVWAPAWVLFREGGGYIGWFPMPPDYGDFDDGPYFGGRYSWDNYYGYGDWYGMSGNSFFNLWIFVDQDHFYRHDYRNYVVDSRRVRSIINQTSDTTHYSTDGDHIVNRSITPERLESITHQRIRPVEARTLLKGDVPMAPVSAGRGLARQEGSGRSGPHLHDSNFKPMIVPAGNENAPTKEQGRPETTPSPQAQPESQPAPGGEKNVPAKQRGGEQTTQPSPQPESQPAPGGEKNVPAKKRGGEQTMQTSPQPESQPAPSGDKKLRGHPAGTPKAQPQAASPEQQGTPPEDKKKKPEPATTDKEKKKHPENETGPGN